MRALGVFTMSRILLGDDVPMRGEISTWVMSLGPGGAMVKGAESPYVAPDLSTAHETAT